MLVLKDTDDLFQYRPCRRLFGMAHCPFIGRLA
jgi:hypothetical protein